MRALSIAATGMSAQQLNVEVIANNIANINTTGYKRTRAEFTDLLYQMERVQGVPTQTGEDIVPEGAQLGLSMLMGYWYRVADVDDLILNTAGVLLGYGAFRLGDAAGRAILPARLVFWGQ